MREATHADAGTAARHTASDRIYWSVTIPLQVRIVVLAGAKMFRVARDSPWPPFLRHLGSDKAEPVQAKALFIPAPMVQLIASVPAGAEP